MKILKIALACLFIGFILLLAYRFQYQRIVNKYSAIIQTTKNSNTQTLEISQDSIKFYGVVLETKESFPILFTPYARTNYTFTDAFVDDYNSGKQFLRLDAMEYDSGAYRNRATALYFLNYNKITRVLITGEKQAAARYSTTTIISQNPLTIDFYYDIARPLECYGDGCRSNWEEQYVWDENKNKFVPKDWDYKALYLQYQKMDANGCTLSDTEGKGLKTLQAIYDVDTTDYCGFKDLQSSRQELNKFIQAKQQLETLIKK